MKCDVAVIMASFNRPNLTISCLRSLFRSAQESKLTLGVHLVDASTNSETALRVRQFYPQTRISRADEDSFWAQSMRTAWEGIQEWNYRYLMWLNDDVELFPEALGYLVEVAKQPLGLSIAVGATKSPTTQDMTYGGKKINSRLLPLHGPRLSPNGSPQAIQLFEGNIVLIPRRIDQKLGGFPAGYRHTMADTVYGLRATRMGIPIALAPVFLGLCEQNPSAEAWRDTRLPALERWKLLTSPRGRPFGPWFRLCREIGAPSWPLYFLSAYLRVFSSVLREFLSGISPQSRSRN